MEDKKPNDTKSYYKFCVVCGQEEGFPEYEGHEPSDHTCYGCKEMLEKKKEQGNPGI